MSNSDLKPILNALRPIHLFSDLTDEQLEQVAGMFHRERVPPGRILIQQGAVGDRFYILMQGKVRVTRRGRRSDRTLAVLVPGDYFGEEAMLRRQRRTATVTAIEPCEVLWLDQKEFQALTKTLPVLKERFEVVVESRRLNRRLRFDWLGKEEVIYLLARKHSTELVYGLIGPGVVLLGALLFLLFYLLTQVLIPLMVSLVLGAASVGWGIWRWVDWGNDYYIMTNYRVVWVEKVVGMYESRVEAPLHTVLSISVSTDQLGRMLNYGDVIVRTYTGKIVLRSVTSPERMREFMEEHWQRTRRLIRQDEESAMDRAIRQRLGLPVKQHFQTPTFEPPASPKPRSGWVNILLNRLFRTRYEEEGTIVYRKHWIILLSYTWKPLLILLAALSLMLARLMEWIRLFSPLGMVVFGGLIATGALGWAIYGYLDWSQDIYRVTPDHIIDVDHKPFGKQQLNSAPLENILSMEHERRGLIGLLLNYGPVSIRIGATTFVFEDVPDPASVQNEIFRRMEVQRRRKAQAEAEKERQRMAEWLAVYHRNAEEYFRLMAEKRAGEEGSGESES